MATPTSVIVPIIHVGWSADRDASRRQAGVAPEIREIRDCARDAWKTRIPSSTSAASEPILATVKMF